MKTSIIIPTIPLTEIIGLFEDVPSNIKKCALNLKFKSLIFVYSILDKEKLSNNHWIYFPDPEEEIFFNRFTEFKNFSQERCSKDKTIICAEITCNFGDKTWYLNEKKLIEKIKNKLIDLNFIEENEILDSFIKKERYAYLVYDKIYKKTRITS